jgi:hypothetical protein
MFLIIKAGNANERTVTSLTSVSLYYDLNRSLGRRPTHSEFEKYHIHLLSSVPNERVLIFEIISSYFLQHNERDFAFHISVLLKRTIHDVAS